MEGLTASFYCRTIHIGSYRCTPKEKVLISAEGIKLVVPSCFNENKAVALQISIKEIVKVLIHFGTGLQVIFVYALIRTGQYVRSTLDMVNESGPNYDPSSRVNAYKKIILLPDAITEEDKVALKALFCQKIDELNSKEAFEFLVNTCGNNSTEPEHNNVTKPTTRSSSVLSDSAAKSSMVDNRTENPQEIKKIDAIITQDTKVNKRIKGLIGQKIEKLNTVSHFLTNQSGGHSQEANDILVNTGHNHTTKQNNDTEMKISPSSDSFGNNSTEPEHNNVTKPTTRSSRVLSDSAAKSSMVDNRNENPQEIKKIDAITEEDKVALKALFCQKIDELNSKEAFEFLVNTCGNNSTEPEHNNVTKPTTRSSRVLSDSAAKSSMVDNRTENPQEIKKIDAIITQDTEVNKRIKGLIGQKIEKLNTVSHFLTNQSGGHSQEANDILVNTSHNHTTKQNNDIEMKISPSSDSFGNNSTEPEHNNVTKLTTRSSRVLSDSAAKRSMVDNRTENPQEINKIDAIITQDTEVNKRIKGLIGQKIEKLNTVSHFLTNQSGGHSHEANDILVNTGHNHTTKQNNDTEMKISPSSDSFGNNSTEPEHNNVTKPTTRSSRVLSDSAAKRSMVDNRTENPQEINKIDAIITQDTKVNKRIKGLIGQKIEKLNTVSHFLTNQSGGHSQEANDILVNTGHNHTTKQNNDTEMKISPSSDSFGNNSTEPEHNNVTKPTTRSSRVLSDSAAKRSMVDNRTENPQEINKIDAIITQDTEVNKRIKGLIGQKIEKLNTVSHFLTNQSGGHSQEANDILVNTSHNHTTKQNNDIEMKISPSSDSFGSEFISCNLSDVKPILIYPPGKGSISIYTGDYMCLDQYEYLNDVIIDFYLKYLLQDVLTQDQRERTHLFNTCFYTRLTTKRGNVTESSNPHGCDSELTPAQKRHASVKNWTKGVNIFEKDFIVIPINENSHWYVAIICFPGLEGYRSMVDNRTLTLQETKKTGRPSPMVVEICNDYMDMQRDPDEEMGKVKVGIPVVRKTEPIKQRCILIFDSVAGTATSRVVAILRDYLTCEYQAKISPNMVFNKDNIKGCFPKVPQQRNTYDCGLYLLQYVEQFFKDPVRDYAIPMRQLQYWFDVTAVTRKREEISNLVKSLMHKSNPDSHLALPHLNFRDSLYDKVMALVSVISGFQGNKSIPEKLLELLGSRHDMDWVRSERGLHQAVSFKLKIDIPP